MSDYLKLVELEIRQFRGIRRPADRMHFPPGMLSPGLNIVCGPNGSGKSTTLGAVQALLWPGGNGSGHAGITGVWQSPEGVTHLSLTGGVQGCVTDGREAPRPPLAESCKPYVLSLQDLIAAEDADLAEAIQQEMYGGVDLAAAVKALAFGEPESGRRAAAKALLEANRRVREVTREQRDLLSRAEELGELEARVAEARDAGSQIRLCEELQRLLEKRAASEGLAARIAELAQPEGLERLRGDELERLEEWRCAMDALDGEIAALKSRAEEARKILAEAGFSGKAVPGEMVLDDLRKRIDALQRQEVELAQAERDLAEAKEFEEKCRQFTGGEFRDDGHVAVSGEGLRRLEPLFKRRRQAVARHEATRAALEVAAGGLPEGSFGAGAEPAVESLLDWLGAVRENHVRGLRSPLPAALLGVGIICVLAVLSVWGWGWLLLLPLGILPTLLWGRPQSDHAFSAVRALAREKYEGLAGVPPIAEWTPSAVRAALRECETLMVRGQAAARLRERVELLQREVAAAGQAVADAERELTAALREAGVECDQPAENLDSMLATLNAWHQAAARCCAVAARKASLAESHGAGLQACHALWKEYFDNPAGDAIQARTMLSNLESRCAAWITASRSIGDAETNLRQAEKQHGELERRIRELIIDRLGADIPPAKAVDEIGVRLPLAARLRECRTEMQMMKRGIEETGNGLAALPGWQPEMLGLTAGEIAERLAAAREARQSYEELHGRLVALEDELRRARAGNTLEHALSERDAAAGQLAAMRRRALESAAGLGVVDFVRDQVSHSASAVLRRAREIFAGITANQYELLVEVVDGQVALSARDCIAAERRGLGELSSATRIQLLLAVRIAFLEERETGVCAPPFMLDEVLANSDEARARSVMETVVALVKRGRQVFYFTAQGDELGKWARLLEDEKEIAWTRIDLPLGTAETMVAEENVAEMLGRLPAPPAEGEDYSEYGRRLRIPQFSLIGGSLESTHVFHLLDQPDQLYRVLQAGCETAGQLQLMRRLGGDRVAAHLGIAAAGFFAVLDVRLRLLQRLRELYSIGRGLPVGKDVIMRSPVARLKYAGQVADLAAELGGDGGKLLAALRDRAIRGFQQRKIDDLEEWLADEGYVDSRPPIPLRDLLPRLLADSAEAMAAAKIAAPDARVFLERVLAGAGDYTALA